MKKLVKIITVLLIVVLSLSAVACSTYGKLEKAFTDAGYEVVENQEAENMEDEEKGITAHYLEKKETLSTIGVIILEFKATDDMIEYYNENEIVRDALEAILTDEDTQDLYQALVDAGIANGNCLVYPATLSAVLAINSVTDIVKNA
ncbi:MAG: hypothetical protein IJW43_05955 [Clostridia bacterium]|nr:hypothetical protein [Clostridia bacterium]